MTASGSILSDFRDGMAQSAATLASVPGDADIGLEVDLARLGIDLDEDGRIDAAGKRRRHHGVVRELAARCRPTWPARRWCSASTAPTAIGCRAMPIS